ncbi:MAG: flagellar hook-associated protein FlgL [Methylophagaceae bacterium]
MRISTAYMFDQNLTAMLNQQTALGQTQLQVSTGKKILNPSDDPISAIAALNLQRELNLTEQYLTNSVKAENKLEVEEGALMGATDILHRIHELAVQGLNDTNTKSDRTAIAQEITQLNGQLLALSNTRDAGGDYLFSGFKTDTQPYTSIGASYAGDSGQRNLQVGAGVLVETNDPGNQIFEADHVQTNLDSSAATDSTLTITRRGINSAIPAGSTLDVDFNSATNSLTVTLGAVTQTITPYTAGEEITLTDLDPSFPDLTLKLDGGLTANDSHQLATVTTNQTLFKTINDFALGLTSNNVSANDSPNNGDFLANISTAMETVIDTQAKVGARLNIIEQQRDVNDGLSLNMQKTLSEIQDLDYAEAISRLTLQMTGLQAAQQSFSRVQGLSLFNYL